MIPLLLAGILVAGEKEAMPVIAIRFEEGFAIPWTKQEKEEAVRRSATGDFEFLAWRDGTILWRDAPIEWGEWNGRWGVRPGRFFSGRVSPARVRQALTRLRTWGVYKVDGYFGSVPDSHSTHITVRDGRDRVEFIYTFDPSKAPRVYLDTPARRRAYPALLLVRREVKGLIPKPSFPLDRRIGEPLWKLKARARLR